ncbi:MAG: hypothetical protein Q7U91_05070 [Sideroxyarcus sp.]|nr:hypothetical protein [Sideroxyarcus sp.]
MHKTIPLAVFLFAACNFAAQAGTLNDSDAGAEKPVNNHASAPAALTEQPMFRFGGFGSLGASRSNQDQGDYVLYESLPKGAGRSGNWTAGNNTRVAAHVSANFTPAVSAILQVDSEYHSDDSYSPRVELVNVKYAFDPDFYMRVGRLALPTFLDSENHDVGYSYAWVNPPVDLYQLSIHSTDGVDATYRSEIGEAVNSIKAMYGSRSNAKEMWGFFDKLEYGQATFQIGYQERQSLTLNQLSGVSEAWIRNSDLSVGASYDRGNWFAMYEWLQRRSIFKINAMYVSGGYRINEFTPYVTYSRIAPGTFLPGYSAPTAAAVQLANRSQRTTSLGVRWDFMRNTDFKIQYDRVRLGDNSNGYLVNVPPDVSLHGSSFHVITAVVDFVF